MDAGWWASLAVALGIPGLIVLLIAVAVWRGNDERRARYRGHRRQFAAFLARVRAMNPPDAVLAFERESALSSHRFSKNLDWPSLAELLPHVGSRELETLRGRVRQLGAAALLEAYAMPDRKARTKAGAAVALAGEYREFSDLSIREALDHAVWEAQF